MHPARQGGSRRRAHRQTEHAVRDRRSSPAPQRVRPSSQTDRSTNRRAAAIAPGHVAPPRRPTCMTPAGKFASNVTRIPSPCARSATSYTRERAPSLKASVIPVRCSTCAPVKASSGTFPGASRDAADPRRKYCTCVRPRIPDFHERTGRRALIPHDPTSVDSLRFEAMDVDHLLPIGSAPTRGCPSHRNAQTCERDGIVRFGTGEAERVWHARGRRPVPRWIEKRHRLA